VSLSPHATEGLSAIGAGEAVVGVDDFSEPPAGADPVRLGTYIDPDLEGILALRPDRVVLSTAHRSLDDQLRRLGIGTLVVPDTRLEDVFRTFDRLGEATCRTAAAARLSGEIREALAASAAASAGPPVRAVLVVDRAPDDVRQLFVAGPGSFLDDILRAAGALNVFEGSAMPFPQVSVEPIVTADPDLVIELLPGGTDEAAAARAAAWADRLPSLRAVREGRVHVLTERWIPVPGPSVAQAVRRIEALVRSAREGER
jgi:iron complex transport system substrate-binding protein